MIMRKYFLFLLLTLLCIAGTSSAQDKSRVIERSVKANTTIKTKTGYNQFLVDQVKSIDSVYVKYEQLVQDVWDKKIVIDLFGTSKDPVKQIEEAKDNVKAMPVYRGGIKYKNSVLQYADTVKRKIQYLEKFGILGADPLSDFDDYTTMSIKFEESTNEATEARNKVRRMKDEFERNEYVKTKRR